MSLGYLFFGVVVGYLILATIASLRFQSGAYPELSDKKALEAVREAKEKDPFYALRAQSVIKG